MAGFTRLHGVLQWRSIKLQGTLYDQGSLCLRIIGIADIDRNAGLSYREYRVLMKYGSSHIRKLS